MNLLPEMSAKLDYYSGESPIFDLYDVENEIQRALERKVELKSGGYLIIDQTGSHDHHRHQYRCFCRPS